MPDPACLRQAGGTSERRPRCMAEWVRDPWVAAIGVVLDDHEPSVRPQMRRQGPNHLDLPLARHEMEAVRRDQAVQVPIVSWPVRAARMAVDVPERILIRISAQRYNEPADYDRLAEALVRRPGRR